MGEDMHMQSVLQGVHAQGNVHSRAVGEEGSQSGLHKQAEDQDPVPVERGRRKGGGSGQGVCRNLRVSDIKVVHLGYKNSDFGQIQFPIARKKRLLRY